jgi:hypothetical protein
MWEPIHRRLGARYRLALPLAAAGLLTFEYLPVGPLAPLGMLLQGR